MRRKNEESGEFVVVGADHVDIPLIDFPHRVEVAFKHKPHHPHPCDPHHHHHHNDELEWEVHRNFQGHHTYVLKIKWQVYDVREIFWVAYY